MTRLSTTLWVLVIMVAALSLYQVKYEVQRVRADIASVTRVLEQEHETLDVVAAEWAYLSRPERIKKLAQKHLAAQNMMVQQVADVEAIAFPPRLEASAPAVMAVVPASAVVGDRQ
ncbi:MAG: hypothetical protein SFW63_06390 [Alphaproteobacteria bacterium]|nr:hypothetical protein [Alphaproteobacteria bacterium]